MWNVWSKGKEEKKYPFVGIYKCCTVTLQVRDGPSEFGATFLGWAPVGSFVYATPCPLLSLSHFWNGLSFHSSRTQNLVLNRNDEKSYALWVTYFRGKRSIWLRTIVTPRPLILTHTTCSKGIYYVGQVIDDLFPVKFL